MKKNYWAAEFDGPAGKLRIGISRETTMSPEGFGAVPHIYPVTIVQARYGGTYEGGTGGSTWLCFPVYPGQLSGWCDSDVECMQWRDYAREGKWPVGHGSGPAEAYRHLAELVAAEAGADLGDLTQVPTWNRDELNAREG